MKLDSLTTEQLRKKFKNNFDLCNFSINVARNIIFGGQPSTLEDILQAIDKRASENKEPSAFEMQ